MNSKYLFLCVCLWLMLSCVLFDQTESFERPRRRRRRNGRKGKRLAKIMDALFQSDENEKLVVTSTILSVEKKQDRVPRRLKLRRR